MVKKLTLKEIADLIDPDHTFLDECEHVVKKRFDKESEINSTEE